MGKFKKLNRAIIDFVFSIGISKAPTCQKLQMFFIFRDNQPHFPQNDLLDYIHQGLNQLIAPCRGLLKLTVIPKFRLATESWWPKNDRSRIQYWISDFKECQIHQLDCMQKDLSLLITICKGVSKWKKNQYSVLLGILIDQKFRNMQSVLIFRFPQKQYSP